MTDEELALVCTHYRAELTDEEGKILPYNFYNFPNSKDENEYTRLTGLDVVKLMEEYPDIYIVTDMKFNDSINTLAVHTVNDKLDAQNLFDRGIDMIYSDFLFPQDFQ